MKSDLCIVNLIAENEEIRQVYSAEVILNTATIREKLELKWAQILRREKPRIKHHHSAKLQTTKQTLTTSEHSNEFTYGDFRCHLKVN